MIDGVGSPLQDDDDFLLGLGFDALMSLRALPSSSGFLP